MKMTREETILTHPRQNLRIRKRRKNDVDERVRAMQRAQTKRNLRRTKKTKMPPRKGGKKRRINHKKMERSTVLRRHQKILARRLERRRRGGERSGDRRKVRRPAMPLQRPGRAVSVAR
ncbi:hypothetical protein TGRH88_062880 [Toxoplasma gondii]|uniref:Uncharacterized protein n=1 Tax=Toxoplasma gondii TaxID=5811 RepID=A0A7J6JVZ6_TOXGO|nr:hypothetical protein TGRH88_062880 [Toxoplasma gondii]